MTDSIPLYWRIPEGRGMQVPLSIEIRGQYFVIWIDKGTLNYEPPTEAECAAIAELEAFFGRNQCVYELKKTHPEASMADTICVRVKRDEGDSSLY